MLLINTYVSISCLGWGLFKKPSQGDEKSITQVYTYLIRFVKN